MKNNILMSTTFEIAGREIQETLGVARGNTIRSRHIGSDIVSSLKGIVGGEIKGYVKAMSDAREEATKRMVQEAIDMGADAIVGVRFTTSSVMAGAAEILVYGTAVRLR